MLFSSNTFILQFKKLKLRDPSRALWGADFKDMGLKRAPVGFPTAGHSVSETYVADTGNVPMCNICHRYQEMCLHVIFVRS